MPIHDMTQPHIGFVLYDRFPNKELNKIYPNARTVEPGETGAERVSVLAPRESWGATLCTTQITSTHHASIHHASIHPIHLYPPRLNPPNSPPKAKVGATFKKYVGNIALGRAQEPEGVASFVAYLASPDSD